MCSQPRKTLEGHNGLVKCGVPYKMWSDKSVKRYLNIFAILLNQLKIICTQLSEKVKI